MIEQCNDVVSHKIISRSENNRTFKINNPSQLSVNVVTVDGCYIQNGTKCDYLFEVLQKDVVLQAFYVELKGKDIFHAIEQLENTIKHCKTLHQNIQKEAYIVASRIPKANTSSQNIKKKFKTKNKIQLFIDTKQKEVTI